jgi:hypothetical protein
MILTDQFVLLNFPRTGSTFAREAVKKLYQRRSGPRILRALPPVRGRATIRELMLPIDRTISASRAKRRSQHGRYGQIPPEYRDRPVVSVMRNPFDLIVSHFEHGFWKAHPIADEALLRERFPSYPELDFDEYLAMSEELGLADVLKGVPVRADVGPLTIHFIRFFFPDPDSVLRRLTDDFIDRRQFVEELPPVRFLHTEDLRRELRGFLESVGFSSAETELIDSLPKTNIAGARGGRSWPGYYRDEARRRTRHKERMLFSLFPEYDTDPIGDRSGSPTPEGSRR